MSESNSKFQMLKRSVRPTEILVILLLIQQSLSINFFLFWSICALFYLIGCGRFCYCSTFFVLLHAEIDRNIAIFDRSDRVMVVQMEVICTVPVTLLLLVFLLSSLLSFFLSLLSLFFLSFSILDIFLYSFIHSFTYL